MYACIKGLILEKEEDHVVLEAGGIGYMIYCSRRSLLQIENLSDENIQLFLEHKIRETEWRLYGFIDKNEREWFRALVCVQSVGAKNALALLSLYTPFDLYNILRNSNETQLIKANGIGPKLATRIITELTDKINKYPDLYYFDYKNTDNRQAEQNIINETKTIIQVQQTLQKMGFDENKSKKAVLNAERDLGDDSDIQSLIKYALRELSS